MLDVDKLADVLTEDQLAAVRQRMHARTGHDEKAWIDKVRCASSGAELTALALELPLPTEEDLPADVRALAISSGALT